MKGGSLRLARPWRPSWLAAGLHIQRMAIRGVRVHFGTDPDRFPSQSESACAGCTRERSHPVTRKFLATHPSPEAPGGKTPVPITHYRLRTRRRSGNLPDPAVCPNFAQRLFRTSGEYVRVGKTAPNANGRPRFVPQRIPRRHPCRDSSSGAYMPGDGTTGKGKIYNLSRNVRSGSREGRTVGKMCKMQKESVTQDSWLCRIPVVFANHRVQ